MTPDEIRQDWLWVNGRNVYECGDKGEIKHVEFVKPHWELVTWGVLRKNSK
jgi:hypothetical protein